MTGEQVRWGLENLALDQKKLDALGFAGVMRPISTSCADHMGAAWARIHTWDGSEVELHVRLVQADEQIIKPMVKAAADKYAAEKKLDAAHAGGLPDLMRSTARGAAAQLAERRVALEEPTGHCHDQHPSQRQRHRGHLQPRDPGAEGRVAAGARGRHRGAARRQRRGQDDDAARRVATCSPASAAR